MYSGYILSKQRQALGLARCSTEVVPVSWRVALPGLCLCLQHSLASAATHIWHIFAGWADAAQVSRRCCLDAPNSCCCLAAWRSCCISACSANRGAPTWSTHMVQGTPTWRLMHCCTVALADHLQLDAPAFDVRHAECTSAECRVKALQLPLCRLFVSSGRFDLAGHLRTRANQEL
jgi:hypothetical protein